MQIATGAGKTYTAVTLAYRLLKWGGFNRILFLVDRNNLAKQTMGEFENYRTPDDGRRFTELYNVNRLHRGPMPESTAVAVSTIQRVFKALRNEEVADTDDPELDGYVPDAPVTVSYNPDIPPETFDLVSEYTYPQSVADNVNVDFDIYRVQTEITGQGSVIEAGTVVPKVHRRTRAQRFEALDEDLEYTSRQLDRSVTPRTRSGPCSKRSRTGSSPRSSPAVRRRPRR